MTREVGALPGGKHAPNKGLSILWMGISYVFALALGGAFWALGQGTLEPLWNMLFADLGATLGIFIASMFFNNSSLYDPFWSVIPIALVIAAFWISGLELTITSGVILFAVITWGVRLTYNFLRSWPGLKHEDWRYQNFRKSTGPLYWLVSLSGIHVFPTFLVFAGMGGALECMLLGTTENTGIVLAGGIICLLATVIEGVADNQLLAFNQTKVPGSIITDGLWAYSRHPNYFGEWLFWFGLAVVAWGGGASWQWVVAGPLTMWALFIFASIPMLDKRSMERRPAYAEHMKSVSGFLPLPPKR